MDTLYVFATQNEYDQLKQFLGIEDDWNVLITGEGYGNIIKALKDVDRENTIIYNVGYCGSNSLPVGTIVNVKSCHCYHPKYDDTMNYADEPYIVNPLGNYDCYTSGDFVTETDIKEPVVFDMELYAICSFGFASVHGIKIVSDNLSLQDYRNATTQ